MGEGRGIAKFPSQNGGIFWAFYGKTMKKLLRNRGVIITDGESRNLQFYIRKRDGNKTDEQIIKHIDEVSTCTPLTDDEWYKLLFPCCNSGCVNTLKYAKNLTRL